MLTDESGDVTDTYTYDAWGKLVEHDGSTSQPYQFVARLGYYMHHQDVNLRLLQLGVCFCDTRAAEFTTAVSYGGLQPAMSGVVVWEGNRTQLRGYRHYMRKCCFAFS